MVGSAVLFALGPAAAFRASLELIRQRPLAISALGLALYTSLVSVCCGFGIVAAPWFACELVALLLSARLGRPMARSPSWLWAGLLQMVAIVLLSSVASLALMSLGVDRFIERPALQPELLAAQLGQGLLVMTVAGSLVLSLTVCFEHAPAILIERGGGLIASLLESARLVSRHGLLRTWATAAVAHGMPMAAALALIVILAMRANLAATVGFFVLLLPLLVLALVVGQGMVVASYLHLRQQVTDPSDVPSSGEPSKLGSAVWAALLSCVALGPLAVSLALLKPAPPRAEQLPESLPIVLEQSAGLRAREAYIPSTALRLSVRSDGVHLSGSDGGGAGELPLPEARVRRVRVARETRAQPQLARRAPAEGTFGVEIQLASGAVYTAWIDEAGVRLDDSLGRRLALRLSPARGLLLVLCFAWASLWVVRALPPLARIRRKLVGKRPARHDAEHERRLRLALRTRVLATSLWLLPPAGGSLAIGLSALLR